MNKLLMAFIVFISLFIMIFIIEYFIINRSKKKKKKESTELNYLITKFKLERKKLPIKKLLIIISIINSFIISIVSLALFYIDTNIIIKFIIGFVLLLLLIYSLYEILGNYLLKKGYGKNGF